MPKDELDSYPASPAERDAHEENLLTAYFHESWEARLAQDWSHLFEMTDPL